MTRQYKRGEKGLETKERYYLQSTKMKRFVNKMSKLYEIDFRIPDFRPVYINARLGRRTWGYFCGSRIEIAKDLDKSQQYETLWHEIIHAFVYDNSESIYKHDESRNKFEKAAFRLAINDGSHNSWNYKLKCDCGHWWKSTTKKHKVFCPNCHKWLISNSEYNKLKRIEKINSRIYKINIDEYKVWKENKKIKLK